MAQYNNARREVVATIVYAGPGLSGKTTNVELIAAVMGGEIHGINTAGERTLVYEHLKVDLGELEGNWRLALHLKTVPGQVQYIRARQDMLRKPDAVVFVADSSAARLEANLYALDDVQRVLEDNGNDLGSVPLVIQYNKRDLEDRVALSELERILNPGGAPAWAARARDGVGVFGTLRTAVDLVHAAVLQEHRARTGAPAVPA